MEPLRPDDPRELGRYRLLRRVGEGGMGVVYLATSADGAGADLAAVKAVRPEYAGDREFRSRFTVEADLARRVRGPYTARVLDADTEGPRPWLATEYVPGPALQDAVRDTGPFPEDSLLALASGLARALSAIHEGGLVHRDLKPSNVLLSTRGPQVIDFGIARAADATALTHTGQALGTPAYMSPEQATGSGLHGASDLFSFGGVLVFAATGRAPFGSGEPAALLYRVVNEEPDLSGLPERLSPLVYACLDKAPEGRPELDAVVAELPGTALPSGDDDRTEWLPAAVDATVHHTLVAATRFLPGGETGDKPGDGEQDVDDAPADRSAVPEAEASDNGTARDEERVPDLAEGGDLGEELTSDDQAAPETDPVAEDRSPAGAVREERSQEVPAPRNEATSAQDVPDGQSHVERPAAPAQSAKPASAVRSPSPARDSAAQDDRGRKALLFAGVLSLALVIALALVPDSEEDTAADDSGVTRGGSSPSSAGSADAEEEPEPPEVTDIAPLSDDRFAVLSNHGVHVYDVDEAEPVEQLPGSPANDEEPGDNPRIGGPPKGEDSPDFTYSTLETTPDGTAVAAFSSTGVAQRIHVWDLESGDHHSVNPAGSDRFERDFALAPDGGTVFASVKTEPDRETVVRAVDTESGDEVFRADLPEDSKNALFPVQALDSSPDGELLYGSLNQGLAVWDVTTGEAPSHLPGFREASTNPYGTMVGGNGVAVTTGRDAPLLWDLHSASEPQELPLPEDLGAGEDDLPVSEVEFNAGGDRIIGAGSVGNLGFVGVWDLAGGLVEEHLAEERSYSALAATPSGNGALVVEHARITEDNWNEDHPHSLRLLDEDLETSQEYELPAPDPDDDPSD